MPDAARARSSHDLFAPRRPCPRPQPIEIFRLRGATDELRGLAVETSRGFAFGLELDRELLLLHLQRDIDSMVAYSHRLKAALIAQGWRVVDTHCHGRSRHVH